jgi:hypothetical protein
MDQLAREVAKQSTLQGTSTGLSSRQIFSVTVSFLRWGFLLLSSVDLLFRCSFIASYHTRLV